MSDVCRNSRIAADRHFKQRPRGEDALIRMVQTIQIASL
jgi:hypothetical protein